MRTKQKEPASTKRYSVDLPVADMREIKQLAKANGYLYHYFVGHLLTIGLEVFKEAQAAEQREGGSDES